MQPEKQRTTFSGYIYHILVTVSTWKLNITYHIIVLLCVLNIKFTDKNEELAKSSLNWLNHLYNPVSDSRKTFFRKIRYYLCPT